MGWATLHLIVTEGDGCGVEGGGERESHSSLKEGRYLSSSNLKGFCQCVGVSELVCMCVSHPTCRGYLS